MQSETRMPLGPAGRKKKEVVTFRCPPELQSWLELRVDERVGVKMTDAVIWALSVGRDFVEATKEFDARLRELQEKADLTSLGVLKRVIAAGLPIVERELGVKKK